MFRRSAALLSVLNKVVSMERALHDLQDNAEVAVGGYGCTGVPNALLQEIRRKGVMGLQCYADSIGMDGWGLATLMQHRQIRRLSCSHVGQSTLLAQRYLSGEMELEFVPQGTLAERMRAGGAGIPAFFTASGYGTQQQTGGQVVRYDKDGFTEVATEPKETREFGGRWYVLEPTIRPHFSLVKAWKSDRSGNLVFRGTARNFNIPAAQCGRCVVAEVEHLVENGDLHPDEIHLPGIYVHRVVHVPRYNVPIEQRTTKDDREKQTSDDARVRQVIARRAALEFSNGMYVNLGAGIPSEAVEYIPNGVSVTLHSENGLLGMGPYPSEEHVDSDFINAGKQTVSFLRGASLFDSATSFAMIRGGHMNLVMIGALEVSALGDVANWTIPGQVVQGPGSAMDAVGCGSRVVVTMRHVNRAGEPKIREVCRHPLAGQQCVKRIITERAVFDVEQFRLVLKEVAEGWSVEAIRDCTAAPFTVAEDIKTMPLAPLPTKA